jgi:hypothetical protein
MVRAQGIGDVDDDVHSAADCSDGPVSASYDQWDMSGYVEIDAAIDRLDGALPSAGLPGLEPPSDAASLVELADAVVPYALPQQLRRFWERVDAERIRVFTFPMLRGPGSALWLLRFLRESDHQVPLSPPPVLLPFEHASHAYGLIELESEWTEGGTIFEMNFDELPLVARSLSDRIDLLAELLSEGRFEKGDDWVSIDHRAELERRIARLDASAPHAVYGDLRAIPIELELWPAHWLAASCVDLGSREPLGATHTIAELVAAADAGLATGRVHGEVTRLVGSGAGALVIVDDGTSPLAVWCPAGTSLWGPAHLRRFEFALTVEGPVSTPPDLDSGAADVTRFALAGDMPAAQHAALTFFDEIDRHRAAAVATDVRPLD